MLVDSHCHLHMLENDPAAVLAEGAAHGVGHFLTVAVDTQSSRDIVALARRFPQVSASVGVHPSAEEAEEPDVDALVEMANDDKVVAIGETGLDYFYNEGDLEWQRERFRRHIAAAVTVDKPLIIHTRKAPEDTVRILADEGAERVGGVIHCFTEDYDTARRCLDLGFYISFSGILTFRNADALRDVAKRLPLDRVLIETDSPYLAPVPKRGQPNQPAYVHLVAEMLAELHDVDFDTVAAQTTENFFELFPLARGQAA